MGKGRLLSRDSLTEHNPLRQSRSVTDQREVKTQSYFDDDDNDNDD